MDSPAKRLRHIRQRRGFESAAAAARRFGWNEVTYRAHEREGGTSSRELTRAFQDYATAFRVSEAWLRCLIDEEDSAVRGTPVVGQAAVGVWHEETVAPQVPEKIVSVPAWDDDDPLGMRFAVRVADASVNKALARDSYAICVPLPDRPDVSEFAVGDILYIERSRRDGLREMSLRRVSAAGGKLTLSTHSTSSKIKHCLAYPPHQTADRIRLVGRLVGIYADYTPN